MWTLFFSSSEWDGLAVVGEKKIYSNFNFDLDFDF